MPFENFGEGIFPREKCFSSMRPPKGTSLVQNRSFDVSLMYNVHGTSHLTCTGVAGKKRKKERKRKVDVIFHIFPGESPVNRFKPNLVGVMNSLTKSNFQNFIVIA
jgi:hypothetical protein